MKVFHSKTGLEVPLRKPVLGSTRDDDFTVLSVKDIGAGKVKVTLLAGYPNRLKHVILPIRGHLWWRRVDVP